MLKHGKIVNSHRVCKKLCNELISLNNTAQFVFNFFRFAEIIWQRNKILNFGLVIGSILTDFFLLNISYY